MLPKDVTHYLLPLEDVARDFLDVLQFKELQNTGMILIQSVVNVVQSGSNVKYKRLCSMIRESGNACVFFANEFCQDVLVQRSDDETLAQWKTRSNGTSEHFYAAFIVLC